MNDIDIAIDDGSAGRGGLLELVKGCTEDSNGVSHAMIPLRFTSKDPDTAALEVVNRAIFKRDTSTNKQGVTSFVMQVKLPYVKTSLVPQGTASATGAARQAVVTKDYISCHIVLALPKAMLSDWRDSARQFDAEVQLNTVLLLLHAWASQHGLVIGSVGNTTDSGQSLLVHTYVTPRGTDTNPGQVSSMDRRLKVEGKPGGRAAAFYMPADAIMRDPLTDPLMSVFAGVCAEVKPSIALNSVNNI